MIKFKELFSFTKKEIQESFKEVRPKCRKSGLKLLQIPMSDNIKMSEDLKMSDDIKISNVIEKEFGKILIIIPGKTAKAYKRNLLRRQIKSIFFEEELYKKLTISILFVYKPAANLTFDQLKEFLTKCV